jgi:hypothetical protein
MEACGFLFVECKMNLKMYLIIYLLFLDDIN